MTARMISYAFFGIYNWTSLLLFNTNVEMMLFRNNKLRTPSNRLLVSLLSADFILLYNCYITVYQSLKGGPIFGVHGKNLLYFILSFDSLVN